MPSKRGEARAGFGYAAAAIVPDARRIRTMTHPAGAFDRQTLVLTACVWAVHLFVNGAFFSFFVGSHHGWDVQLARAICSILAACLCLLAHLLLRWRREATFGFLMAVLLSTIPLAIAQTWLGALVFREVAGIGDPWPATADLAMDYLGYQWVFLAWAALYVGLSHALDVRAREARLAEAERLAQQAQLTALRLQINPHFLFNTLNTVAGLVALGRREDSEATLQNLSQFLRYTLAAAPAGFATVTDEVGMLQRYLRIEQMRFPDRLRVRYRVDPGSAAALLPSFALLPLVENAIKHGLGESEEGIAIEIGAARDGDRLVAWVENDADATRAPREGFGIGLENVRQRLAVMFGNEAGLESHPVERGWRAGLSLPWMEAA